MEQLEVSMGPEVCKILFQQLCGAQMRSKGAETKQQGCCSLAPLHSLGGRRDVQIPRTLVSVH